MTQPKFSVGVMVSIETIRPTSKDTSGKYSANLYKFLKKNHWQCDRVYAIQWSMWDGSFLKFNPENPRPSEIFIGKKDSDGFMSGRRLSGIISGGKGYLQCYAMMPHSYPNAIDITDWFYSNYEMMGRALWDASGTMHMIGDEKRFTVIGGTKRCNWSGRWYKKEIKKSVKITRRDEWLPA